MPTIPCQWLDSSPTSFLLCARAFRFSSLAASATCVLDRVVGGLVVHIYVQTFSVRRRWPGDAGDKQKLRGKTCLPREKPWPSAKKTADGPGVSASHLLCQRTSADVHCIGGGGRPYWQIWLSSCVARAPPLIHAAAIREGFCRHLSRDVVELHFAYQYFCCSNFVSCSSRTRR